MKSSCPRCGESGFDGQGHYSVGNVRMYRNRCWHCGLRFAVESPQRRQNEVAERD